MLINYGIIPPSGKYGRFNFKTLNTQGLAIMSILTSFIIFPCLLLLRRKTTVICPKCEHPSEYIKNAKEKKKCPKCGLVMVPLKDFYNNNKINDKN